MQELLEIMTRQVLRHTSAMKMQTRLPRVGIGVVAPHGTSVMTGCGAGVCLVLQGAKQMQVGNRFFRHEAGSGFASLVELPTTRSVYEFGDGRPYVATSLKLDADLLASLLAELPPRQAPTIMPGFSVATMPRALLEAWAHHLALLDTPDDIPILSQARERELLYRLIQSPLGPLLHQIAGGESRLAQVRRAIGWMRRHFHQPVAVMALADIAGMSLSSFNRHFKAATSTSPLQYLKTLRLQAARHHLATGMDATRAAFAVGYESTSQFSREYARLFGQPPRRDAADLRRQAGGIVDIML